MESKQEPPNAAEVKAAVKYWSRINRCQWRANGNAFYTRALRYLKHGHEPQSLPKRARRTFDNWMGENPWRGDVRGSSVLRAGTDVLAVVPRGMKASVSHGRRTLCGVSPPCSVVRFR